MGRRKNETSEASPGGPLTGGLASVLFTPVQARVLGILFGRPERRFQSAEVIRLVGSGTGAAHRVLSRLADAGLLSVSLEGHQKYYRANPQSPIFSELRGLVRKTVGLVDPLREAVMALFDDIDAAFIYGSVAVGTDRATSDIDLLVISNELSYAQLLEATDSAEQIIGRRVNAILMLRDEWQVKLRERDSFVTRILRKPRLMLIGSEDDLR